MAASTVCPKEFGSLKWQNMKRFLSAPPASGRDTELLINLLQFIIAYMDCIPNIGKFMNLFFLFLGVFKTSKRCICFCMKVYVQNIKVMVTGLRTFTIISCIVIFMIEMHILQYYHGVMESAFMLSVISFINYSRNYIRSAEYIPQNT